MCFRGMLRSGWLTGACLKASIKVREAEGSEGASDEEDSSREEP